MVLGDHVEVLPQGTVGDETDGPLRCEASRLGSELRPEFHGEICNLSVGRRLAWSVLKAVSGDRRKLEVWVARLLEEHGWRVRHASCQPLSSSR